MKPDTPNTGSNLPAAETGSVNVQKNTGEKPAPNVENTPSPGASAAAPKDNTVSGQTVPVSTSNDDQSSTTQTPVTNSFQDQIAQLPAEETDLIESEWVDKADEIEQKTANDPYHEDDAQHELSRAYLKKRFGMDIK
jgi:hypothetical protein